MCRGDLNAFLGSQPQLNYIRLKKDGTTLNEQKCKTEIIRHQIHHPENTLNPKYTALELKQSIELMRQYLLANPLKKI